MLGEWQQNNACFGERMEWRSPFSHRFFWLICISLFVLISGFSQPQPKRTLATQEMKVIDGDSVKVMGENVRLVGFNTPEIFRPNCPYEKRIGQEAKVMLQGILDRSETTYLHFERRSDGRLKRDKYRRPLAVLYADGQDVAHVMVRAGLAEYYDGRRKRRNWCVS